jgi:hypothetical protein
VKKTMIISLAIMAALPLFTHAAMGRDADDNSPAPRPIARRVSSVPFELDKRVMPVGRDLEKLLPKNVGEFTRHDFELSRPEDEDLNVTYRSGDDLIVVGLRLPGTDDDAQDGVRATRREALIAGLDLSNGLYSVGSEPSYLRLPAFMSWSRGSYFFYADAATPDALSRFMRAFPY